MPSSYALCLGVDSQEVQIPLDANNRVEFWDGTQVVEVISQPDLDPPTGLFPIYWGGLQLVPYCLVSLSIETIGNIVREKFAAEAASCFQVVQYDNGLPVTPDPNGHPWAYVAVAYGQGSELYSGATGDFRTDGILRVEIRQRIGTGDGDSLECADEVDVAFRYQVDDPIRYGPPTLRTVGQEKAPVGGASNSASGNWWRNDVIIPFAVDRPA